MKLNSQRSKVKGLVKGLKSKDRLIVKTFDVRLWTHL